VPCTQLLEELRICACIVTSKAWSSSAMMTRGPTDRCRARPAANVAKAKAPLEEDRLDGAEKGASSAIAGPRNSTAAPNVSPDCTRRRAVLVASGVCRRQPRPWCVLRRQRWREIILGEVV
jgi:hypothetical protein